MEENPYKPPENITDNLSPFPISFRAAIVFAGGFTIGLTMMLVRDPALRNLPIDIALVLSSGVAIWGLVGFWAGYRAKTEMVSLEHKPRNVAFSLGVIAQVIVFLLALMLLIAIIDILFRLFIFV